MESLYLVVRMAENLVAMRAEDVSSVVEIDAITPVPWAARPIAGLCALRSRVLTVIDGRAALGLEEAEAGAAPISVVFTSDGHGYALLVDQIEDVISAGPPTVCPAVLGGGWARVTTGQLDWNGRNLLLIDPGLLLADDAIAA